MDDEEEQANMFNENEEIAEEGEQYEGDQQ